MEREQRASLERRFYEVILNLTDTIAKHESEAAKCALSFDFVAALDSVDHVYLLSTMKLFNLSNSLNHMLKSLISGRTAHIVDDLNNLSKPFEIGRGVPQGNLHSPLTFIMGEAPLLIELETKLNQGRSSSATSIEAFADDMSIIADLDTEHIMQIKQIMSNFGNLTGLLLNEKKTVVLLIVCSVVPDNFDQTGLLPIPV